MLYPQDRRLCMFCRALQESIRVVRRQRGKSKGPAWPCLYGAFHEACPTVSMEQGEEFRTGRLGYFQQALSQQRGPNCLVPGPGMIRQGSFAPWGEGQVEEVRPASVNLHIKDTWLSLCSKNVAIHGRAVSPWSERF